MNLSQEDLQEEMVRPGAPVCNPGQPANNVGMLGGTQTLYNNPVSRPVNTRQRSVNGLALLNNQGG